MARLARASLYFELGLLIDRFGEDAVWQAARELCGKGRGRRYVDDKDRLWRMVCLIEERAAAGRALSVTAAAREVAKDTAGQSEDAIVRRLRRKYKALKDAEPLAAELAYHHRSKLAKNPG